MTKFFAALAIAGVSLLGSGFGGPRAPAQVPSVMTGGWAGSAQVVGRWTELDTIHVTLFIAPAGLVTGTIGNAVLRYARLERDRGVFGRMFRFRTDWVMAGDLEGMMTTDGVQATRVTMPLNWVHDHFEGSFVASAQDTVGIRTVVLVGTQLRLNRLR